jgi:hypothetical protein
MTRVTAGAMPELRAARRASLPLSSFFLLCFISVVTFISISCGGDFADGAPGLVDGFVGVGEGAGVGIRNVNAPERLASDFTW